MLKAALFVSRVFAVHVALCSADGVVILSRLDLVLKGDLIEPQVRDLGVADCQLHVWWDYD